MAKNTKKETKNKKHFFKDFKAELKRVIWPTPEQLIKNTIAVVVIVLITAAIVFILDLVFDLGSNYGVNRLKANIRNSIVIENSVEQENTIENNEVEEVNEVNE